MAFKGQSAVVTKEKKTVPKSVCVCFLTVLYRLQKGKIKKTVMAQLRRSVDDGLSLFQESCSRKDETKYRTYSQSTW